MFNTRINPFQRHSDTANTNNESEEYQKGYSDGWYHQPEKSESPDYKKGYVHGWNNKEMDSN